MAENSAIQWTDHTFNSWEGCQKVSPGCDNCYAETRNARFSGGEPINWGPGAPRRRTSVKNWNKPRAWNAAHTTFQALHGRRQRVFCASLADVFDNAVDPSWRRDLGVLILATPQLDWLLLTKRIGNAAGMLADMFPGGVPEHVWLGATIVNQAEAERDIPKLLQTSVSKRFLSIEPLLGPIDLRQLGSGSANVLYPLIGTKGCAGGDGQVEGGVPALDWVIVGYESGRGARPGHPKWARDLRDQCVGTGVPFFYKQHGEWLPTTFCTDEQASLPHRGLAYVRLDGSVHDGKFGVDFFGGDEEVTRVGKEISGRVLDGHEWSQVPGAA